MANATLTLPGAAAGRARRGGLEAGHRASWARFWNTSAIEIAPLAGAGVGPGRVVASRTDTPNSFVNLGYEVDDGGAMRQCDRTLGLGRTVALYYRRTPPTLYQTH